MAGTPHIPTRRARGALVAAAIVAVGGLGGCAQDQDPVSIGLITKQEQNPFWVTMRDVAQDAADDAGADLMTATGTSDVDVASQQRAIAEMVADGVDGILLAPTSSTELAPAIEAARAAGVLVLALDTPVDPVDGVDAYFATDGVAAGELIGTYAAAKARELGLEPRVAMLNLAPGITTGEDRREGFLRGFGIQEDDAAVVAEADTEGDQDKGRSAMEGVLARTPDVNVVYTVNEPAALGALEALRAAGKDLDRVVVVSVDGGCAAMKDAVRPGDIDATAMQFPQNMAREGVLAITEAVRDQQPVSGFLDTGTQLVTGDPAPGVTSRSVAYGVRTCWGD